MTSESPTPPDAPVARPFRRAVLRGLAILMPPLLTIVLFIWAWSVIERYVLVPVESLAGEVVIWSTRRIEPEIPYELSDKRVSLDDDGQPISFNYERRVYTRSSDGKWVGFYSESYVKENFLRRSRVLPFFIAVFLLVLYLLGKFVAAGVGRMIISSAEALVHRLPLVSNVYSSVKQVTDFVFSEREIEFNRVVAVEYPRKGIWSIGFVTGESMLDIRAVANEPVLSVLMPTSPMPMTGFTITCRKSEAVDLNITVDQAIQFVVSCGVVVPSHQQLPQDKVTLNITAAIAQRGGDNGQSGKGRSAEPRSDALDGSE